MPDEKDTLLSDAENSGLKPQSKKPDEPPVKPKDGSANEERSVQPS